MFLYISNAKDTRLTCRTLPGCFLGRMQVLRDGPALLLWFEDRFTRTRLDSGRVSIHVARPKIDAEPVVQFYWDLRSGDVQVQRRWSGEFAVYVAEKPQWILASHLRLVAWVCKGIPPGVILLSPGSSLTLKRKGRLCFNRRSIRGEVPHLPPSDYDSTVASVRQLVCSSVTNTDSHSTALLLSGGVDSSVIAAATKATGRTLSAYVFGLRRAVQSQRDTENDLLNARVVARYVKVPLREILLTPVQLAKNVPIAVALSETPRGTIVDDGVALVEVARTLSEAGFSAVWTGEAADDLFGGFKFPLRYYRGQQLNRYYQHELDVSLPNELCILQKIFEPWSISVVHPFWTAALKALGQSLPLEYRIDSRRLMKRVLRDAFSDILPCEIRERPKGITRDTTQIRLVLESRFGKSRERYRAVFHHIFRDGFRWPARLNSLVKMRSKL